MTRETVFFDTPAMRATSLIVGRLPGLGPARAAEVSSSVKLDLSRRLSLTYNRHARRAMASARPDGSSTYPLTPVTLRSNHPPAGAKTGGETGDRTQRDWHLEHLGGPGVNVASAPEVWSGTEAVAARFVEARLASRALPDYPGPVPVDMAGAYAIQDAAIAAWPDRVAGWKLGRIPSPLDVRFGAGRLVGPVFSRVVWLAGPEPTVIGTIPGGFAAVEAEYVLEIAEIPTVRPRGGEPWHAESVAPYVAAVHIGVEIAGSPFAGINDHGPAVTASDFGNNAGLILGGAISNWRERLDDLVCRMEIDGVEIGTGGARSIPGGPLESLAFLLNLLEMRGRRLDAGQLISTGAATGVHRIEIGQSALADFGDDGQIACVTVPASGASHEP